MWRSNESSLKVKDPKRKREIERERERERERALVPSGWLDPRPLNSFRPEGDIAGTISKITLIDCE